MNVKVFSFPFCCLVCILVVLFNSFLPIVSSQFMMYLFISCYINLPSLCRHCTRRIASFELLPGPCVIYKDFRFRISETTSMLICYFFCHFRSTVHHGNSLSVTFYNVWLIIDDVMIDLRNNSSEKIQGVLSYVFFFQALAK